MIITFKCPNCGKQISTKGYPFVVRGDSIKCEYCRTIVRIPTKADIAPAGTGEGTETPPTTLTPSGFNWGAFLVIPFWLLGHKFWLWAAGYILGMFLLTAAEVGLLKFLVHLAFGVFLGIRANKMLWATGRYKSVEELRRRERPWAIFGFVSSAVVLLLLLLLILSLR